MVRSLLAGLIELRTSPGYGPEILRIRIGRKKGYYKGLTLLGDAYISSVKHCIIYIVTHVVVSPLRSTNLISHVDVHILSTQ